jgi:hypothetical protein
MSAQQWHSPSRDHLQVDDTADTKAQHVKEELLHTHVPDSAAQVSNATETGAAQVWPPAQMSSRYFASITLSARHMYMVGSAITRISLIDTTGNICWQDADGDVIAPTRALSLTLRQRSWIILLCRNLRRRRMVTRRLMLSSSRPQWCAAVNPHCRCLAAAW